MKILVSGGAGYIGSNCAHALIELGHQVTVVDDLSTGNIKLLPKECTFIRGDLIDTEVISAIKREQFQACLHFAGKIIVPESVREPVKYFEQNTFKAMKFFELLCQLGVEYFIFSSTAAVYGLPTGGICHEHTAVAPINPYGRSKLMTEWILQDLSCIYPIKFACLRYFNVAGANLKSHLGQWSREASHLIKLGCQVAIGERSQLSIFDNDYATPDGSCIRDFIHVEDLATCHLLMLKYLEQGGESQIVNCGYGKGASVFEVVGMLEKIIGREIPKIVTARREGDAPILLANNSKLIQLTGFKPKYQDLKYIIESALEWEKYAQKYLY